jgi:transcriptional regulator with XRE-family HTH domain
MKSNVVALLPPPLRRSLAKFGADIAVARKKRNLTARMMAERIGVSTSTYLRLEKGDPTVSMGAYALALFDLGFGTPLGEIIDIKTDDQGLLMDTARLPQRVRAKKVPKPL